MSFWGRLLHLLGLRPDPGPRTFNYAINDSLHESLLQLATRQDRPLDKITPELVTAGIHQYQQEWHALLAWERLTLPERDAVALACLGYNNREIAARLQKTRPNIANRLQRSYIKLGVKNRVELHALFIDWDFSAWGPPSDVSP